MAGETGIDPVVARVIEAATGGEREVLEAFVDLYRDAVVRKVADLDDEQARRRLVASSTTLGGLLKHLRLVEMNWFQRVLARNPDADLAVVADWSGETGGFDLDPDDTVAGLVAAYREQCELSRRLAGDFALDDVVPHDEIGSVSLRWILVHMVDETARHAGHADILREQLDGRVGVW